MMVSARHLADSASNRRPTAILQLRSITRSSRMTDDEQPLPPHLDYDEWTARDFSTVALAPPSDQLGIQKCLDDLRARAIEDPKSDDAKAWRLVQSIERL